MFRGMRRTAKLAHLTPILAENGAGCTQHLQEGLQARLRSHDLQHAVDLPSRAQEHGHTVRLTGTAHKRNDTRTARTSDSLTGMM